ncbi:unnamed protein product [Urochloa decumbens]|uniref:DEK-C domain-containing protein n=1 Tax=Urochloa decumbens TaxID=240449 RepID=A0ABC9AE79_9POAL
MDEATKKKVEETVLEILRGSDMDSVTEYKVRSAAADRLGIDLSAPDRKRFVRGVVEGYLTSLSSQEVEEEQPQQQGGAGEEAKGDEEEEEEEEEEEAEGGARKREYDDNGDLILCRVSFSSPLEQEEGHAVGIQGQDAGVHPGVLHEGRQGAAHQQRNKHDSRAVGSISQCCTCDRGCNKKA